jgi:hypothetical protein
MTWNAHDLRVEILGEFEAAQVLMAEHLRRNWWLAHSLFVLRKQESKKRWSLRTLRMRLCRREPIECKNPKCRVQFVPYRGDTEYCTEACRVRALSLAAYYRRRKPDAPARACAVCGVSFLGRRRHALYCSPACNVRAKQLRKQHAVPARGESTA